MRNFANREAHWDVCSLYIDDGYLSVSVIESSDVSFKYATKINSAYSEIHYESGITVSEHFNDRAGDFFLSFNQYRCNDK